MTEQWVVLLRSGDRPDDTYVFGPLADKETAGRFADFLTTEVDPARAYAVESPVPELLNFWRLRWGRASRVSAGGWVPAAGGEATGRAKRPIGWPPQPGDVWQDRDGNRWVCARAPRPYLVCISRPADDSAEEIWRLFGPMTRVQFVAPTLAEEPPF